MQIDRFSESYHICLPAIIQINNQNMARTSFFTILCTRFGQGVIVPSFSCICRPAPLTTLDPDFLCLEPILCPSLEDSLRLFPVNAFPESWPTYTEILEPPLRQHEQMWALETTRKLH